MAITINAASARPVASKHQEQEVKKWLLELGKTWYWPEGGLAVLKQSEFAERSSRSTRPFALQSSRGSRRSASIVTKWRSCIAASEHRSTGSKGVRLGEREAPRHQRDKGPRSGASQIRRGTPFGERTAEEIWRVNPGWLGSGGTPRAHEVADHRPKGFTSLRRPNQAPPLRVWLALSQANVKNGRVTNAFQGLEMSVTKSLSASSSR
jgi:hypothetical protein